MKKIAVIGAGSWGTALALSLERGGHGVHLFDVSAPQRESLRREKENHYLPGIPLPIGENRSIILVDSTSGFVSSVMRSFGKTGSRFSNFGR